ncbi:MAG: hypothetical protein RIB01_15340 [Balneola sp.]
MKNLNVTNAHRYAVEKSKQHPELKAQIVEFIELMYDEIESGESADNEATLLISSVNELIDESSHK